LATHKNIDQFITLTKKRFKIYLEIAISVFLFILFFQPFPLGKFEFENNLLFIAGFGVITLFFLIVSQILFQSGLIRAEEEMSENSIYMPLYFFTQVLTTSLAFVFYIRYVGQTPITFVIVVKVIFISISLPVTIYLKNKIESYQVRLKRLIHESRAAQDKLKQFSESYTNKFIELISENESDNFRILVSEIVFVKSANNYVEIGYQDEGGVKKKMIRNTLRNVELQLREFNNFIRTHRTSIVNIQHVNRLNKDFNTFWLSFDNTKETIPVSRQYLMAVKELL
jgi:DNA-binding LytR/AlgR family response regulator